MIKFYKTETEFISDNKGTIKNDDVAVIEDTGKVILGTNNYNGFDYKVVATIQPSYIQCKYNITSASKQKILFDQDKSDYIKGIQVDDGEIEDYSVYYTFTTTGEHTVKFHLHPKPLIINALFKQITTLKEVDFSHCYNKVSNMCQLFYKCTGLTKVDFTGLDVSTCIRMDYLLSNASALTTIVGFDKLNFASMPRFRNNDTFYKYNMTTTKSAFQTCNKLTTAPIFNESVKNIGSYALNHLSGIDNETYTIPKNIDFIAYAHVFHDFGKKDTFKKFIVAEGNKNFVVDEYGALYTADWQRLIAIPKAMPCPNKKYYIHEGCTEINECCFSYLNTADTVVFPNSYSFNGYEWDAFNKLDKANAGSQVHTGFYCYTTVQKFEVKEDNPYYKSVNGCIYTKDGTHLCAVPYLVPHAEFYTDIVPTKMDIVIPEGTEYIDNQAFAGMHIGSTPSTTIYNSISIPSTVKYIDDNPNVLWSDGKTALDELTVLNDMMAKAGVTITIAEGNPYYKIENNKIVKK